MPGTTIAYAAAFPVGLPATKDEDTGLSLKTTSVDAFRADGSMLDPSALGDPDAFTGGGYMLLGLEIDGLAAQYRDESTAPRRTHDGVDGPDAACARAEPRLRRLRCVGARAARQLPRRRRPCA